LMSATVLSKERLCEELGLDINEVHYISMPSTFPKRNRLFICDYVGYFNYKNQEVLFPDLVEKIKSIFEAHPKERGIIHVPSYKLAINLEGALRDTGRITFPQSSFYQKEALAKHAEQEDSVLLSPSMSEGVDLKDSLSRFQIIGKVPFPSLADPVVKRKMEIVDGWYEWATMLTIIQSHGRSIRSDTDYAKTYMLDGNFERIYKQTKYYLPKSFTEIVCL
jgi:ATP-dependent DNA helicase DinG